MNENKMYFIIFDMFLYINFILNIVFKIIRIINIINNIIYSIYFV